MPKLTEAEVLVLSYLDSLMWSDAYTVGRLVYVNRIDPSRHGSNLVGIGAAVLGRLRKREFVAFLQDIEAWRITTSGREALRALGQNDERK